MKNTFQSFLESKMKENHLYTMEEVADKTGVSVSTISRIRSGKILPSIGTAKQIAEAFGSTVEEAMGIDSERVCVGANIVPALMDNFGKVTEAQQNKLDTTLKLLEAKEEQVKHLTEENERVVKAFYKARMWAIACAVAIGVLLVVIIAILIYDLTHLDRGWFTTFFDRAVRTVLK